MPQSEPPVNTPYIVPEYLISGEIWNWLFTPVLYTPADGFTLTYYFNLLNDVAFQNLRCSFNIATTVNGNNYWTYKDSGTIVPDQSPTVPALVAGEYQWYSRRSGTSNGTTVKERAQWGQLTIFPDQTTGVDVRTLERIIFEALEAMIKDTASMEQQEYTLGNRHIGKMNRKDLLMFRDRYKTICQAQARKMSFESGNVKATNDIRLYNAPKKGSPNLNPLSPWRGWP